MRCALNGLIALYTIVGIVACTTTPKDDKEQLNKEEQQKLEEFRAELEIGRNMAGRLLAAYGTQQDSALADYVNQIGSYVGSYSEFPARKYMFEIIRGDFVNAFACPGGYILITLGTIKHAQNEAELAGVLAHEIAHVGRKHMFDKLRNMSAKELTEANELTNRKKLPPNVKMRQRPKGDESKLGAMVAKYLSGGAAGLNIVKAAGAGMALMLETGLGADKEYEADSHGVRYAVSSGYDPKGLSQFLCRIKNPKASAGDCTLPKLKKKKGKKEDSILDKTHPPIPQRIAKIDKVLKDMEAGKMVGAKGKKRYSRWRKKLL